MWPRVISCSSTPALRSPASARGARVRYVDEFRDAELGRAVAAEIASTVDAGRHYKVMEVCGGHTHSIYKYGVDDLLPPNVELVHGPGCPVCVIPMGRVDDGIAVARNPEVIFTCFGDMLRVPGANGTLLDAKAEGADVRMVYSPLDALRIARDNPDRVVVFFAIGFETTAPSTALTLRRAQGRGASRTSSACATTSRSCRRCARCWSRPTCSSTASSARATSRRSSVRGRSSSSRADYGKPLVDLGLRAARPPAVGADDHAPARRGSLRGREPVLARRAVRGQPRRAARDGRGVRAAPALRVARPRVHLAERAAALGRLPRVRCRGALRGAERARRRSQGVPVRRGAEGRDQALGVQGVRQRMHARSTRSARAWSRPRAPAPRTTPTGASRASARWCERGGALGRQRARAARARRDREAARAPAEAARRAHHDGARRGRQGHADADRGRARARPSPRRRSTRWPMSRRSRPAARGSRSRPTASSSSRSASPADRSASSRSTARSTTSRWAARARSRSASRWCSRRVSPPTCCARRSRRSPLAAAAAGVEVVTGDTKVVERGHADSMYLCTTGHRARRRARATSRRRTCSPATA